ncbi:MAG: hypothetical protein P1V21_15205 [Rhizobiaceae bacterium]|nr:hypothetical protein [Rhizobiaceae bacterium]
MRKPGLSDFAILLLAIVALSAGWALVPGPVDHVVSLYNDGKFDVARTKAEALYANGVVDPDLMLNIYDQRTHAGDIEGTRRIIEELARLHSNVVRIQEVLASHYLTYQEMDKYVAILELRPDLAANGSAASQVLAYLRYNGDFEREFALLTKIENQTDVKPADLGRLGLLYAARGEVDKAQDVLERFDAVYKGDGERERAVLVSLLLRHGQHLDAFERSRIWMTMPFSLEFKAFLVNAFKDAGRFKLADLLLRVEATSDEDS